MWINRSNNQTKTNTLTDILPTRPWNKPINSIRFAQKRAQSCTSSWEIRSQVHCRPCAMHFLLFFGVHADRACFDSGYVFSAQLKSIRFLSGRGSSVAGRSGWSSQLRRPSWDFSGLSQMCEKIRWFASCLQIHFRHIYMYTLYTHIFIEGNPPHQGFNLVINDHCYQLTTDRRSLRADALRLCYFLWLASGIAKTLTFERGYWNPRATGETIAKPCRPVIFTKCCKLEFIWKNAWFIGLKCVLIPYQPWTILNSLLLQIHAKFRVVWQCFGECPYVWPITPKELAALGACKEARKIA